MAQAVTGWCARVHRPRTALRLPRSPLSSFDWRTGLWQRMGRPGRTGNELAETRSGGGRAQRLAATRRAQLPRDRSALPRRA
eukprot:364556-Chlamydomonas_euryale.AAC.3